MLLDIKEYLFVWSISYMDNISCNFLQICSESFCPDYVQCISILKRPLGILGLDKTHGSHIICCNFFIVVEAYSTKQSKIYLICSHCLMSPINNCKFVQFEHIFYNIRLVSFAINMEDRGIYYQLFSTSMLLRQSNP